MIEKIKSTTITSGVKIEAVAQFVENESSPQKDLFVFIYKIRITNEGTDTVKLRSRCWLIINADGREKKVEGPGVVGYYPELNTGQAFEYTSWSPLSTEWGTMEGYFVFDKKDGTSLKAHINRFHLTTEARDTIGKL